MLRPRLVAASKEHAPRSAPQRTKATSADATADGDAAGIGAGLTDLFTTPAPSEPNSCLDQAAAAERRAGIPEGLLQAVSLAESGRWDPEAGRSYGWPWTVTSGDESWYLDSRADAIALVERLRAQGRSNIDVGCMQINLRWHPDAFETLHEAFDPAANVAYAVEFLTSLRDALGSWDRAVARYHTADERRGDAYRDRVEALRARLDSGKAPDDRIVASAREARRAAAQTERPTAATRAGGLRLRWFVAEENALVPVDGARQLPGSPMILRGRSGSAATSGGTEQEAEPRRVTRP